MCKRRVLYPSLLSVEEYDAPIDLKGLSAYTGLKAVDIKRMMKTNSPVSIARVYAPELEWAEDTSDEDEEEDEGQEDSEGE